MVTSGQRNVEAVILKCTFIILKLAILYLNLLLSFMDSLFLIALYHLKVSKIFSFTSALKILKMLKGEDPIQFYQSVEQHFSKNL